MPELLRISVVYASAARQVREVSLRLPAASRLCDALHASGLLGDEPSLATLGGPPAVGVWGRAAHWEQPLHDLDRVEIYRPLLVDPKVARRARFQGQGARATGLFAQKRAGAKAGYGG